MEKWFANDNTILAAVIDTKGAAFNEIADYLRRRHMPENMRLDVVGLLESLEGLLEDEKVSQKEIGIATYYSRL